MRRSSAALAATALGAALALSASANAQFNHDAHKPVIGYQDENGTFHSMDRAEPDAASLVTVTGTVTIKFIITVKTALPSGTKFYCGADLVALSESATSPLTPTTYGEEAAAEGTSTACSVTVNYSWKINPTGAGVENLLTGSYTVVAYNSSLPAVAAAVGSRVATGAITGLGKIPATSTTTPITIDVTL